MSESGSEVHPFESVRTPRRNLELHKNPMPVAIIEDPLVLRPVHASENAIQIFQVAMVVVNPFRGFGHAPSRMAACHALDAHQPHRFAVEMKLPIPDFEFSCAKLGGAGVRRLLISDGPFKLVKLRRIKMPQPHGLQSRLRRDRPPLPWVDREMLFDAGGDRQPGPFVAYEEGRRARPGLCAGISANRRNRNRGIALEIGNGFDGNALNEGCWCHQQLHRPENSAIMGPVAGSAAGQHVVIKRIVHSHGDGVDPSPAQLGIQIKFKCRIALAHVLARGLAVYPNGCSVKHRLEFNAHRAIPPPGRDFQRPPVPRDAAIFRVSRIHLPGVRDFDIRPSLLAMLRPIPRFFGPDVSSVHPKFPLAAKTHSLSRRTFRCPVTRSVCGIGNRRSSAG